MDEKNNNLFYFSCWHIIIPKISFYSIHKYNCYGYETKKTIFIVSSKYRYTRYFTLQNLKLRKKNTHSVFYGLCVSLLTGQGQNIFSRDSFNVCQQVWHVFTTKQDKWICIQSTQAQQDLISSWWNLDRTTEPRGPFCGHKNLYTNNQFIANLWLVWKKKLLQEIHNLSKTKYI